MATREKDIELACSLLSQPRWFMVRTTLLPREHYNIAVVLQLNEILPKLHLIALSRHKMKAKQMCYLPCILTPLVVDGKMLDF